MIRASYLRRMGNGICAGTLILSPALAQQSQTGVTTVSPLMVTGGLPKVGDGATLFTPQELEAVAAHARQDHLDARDAARDCGAGGSLGGPTPEDMGTFGVGALLSTESRAQYNLQQAALAARTATDAALTASAAAARGEGSQADLIKAELARQAATKAYQDARQAVSEAHNRTLDLLELADQWVGGDLFSLRALEQGHYVSGCQYGERGELVSSDQRCIQRANFQTMREVQPQLEYRALQRIQNGGSRVIYTPAQYADLRLVNVVARRVEENGASVVRVSGKIVNPRRSAIAVPPLWVEIIDQYGTSLKAEQIVAPRGQGKIPTRDSLAFTYAVNPVPEKMARASVTFAPLHRPTPYLVPSMACPSL
jgi:hypothetical protein